MLPMEKTLDYRTQTNFMLSFLILAVYPPSMVDHRRIAIYLGSFIGPLSGNAVLSLVPSLMILFKASASEILASITFFMLPFATFMLFSGTLSDIIGRKRVLSFGFMIYALGSILTGSSTSLWYFYAARTITGLGFAFVQPVLMAMLGDIVPYQERGRAMGFLGAATTAGIALGPFLAGYMSIINWRLTFFIIAVLALGIWVWVIITCEDIYRKRTQPHFRAFLNTLGIGLHEPSLLILAATGFTTFLCYIGTQSFLSATVSAPPLLLSEENIGLILSSAGLAGIFSAPVGGKMVDKWGAVYTAILGYLIMFSAFLIMSFAGSMIDYILSLIILGSGTAIVWASLLSIAVSILNNLKGTSSSIFNSARFLGYAFAPIFFTPIYVNLGFDAVNLTSASLALMAIVMLWLAERIKRRSPILPM
ncbi:MAG: MFS transporter [Methanomassiliicoccales archaeon]